MNKTLKIILLFLLVAVLAILLSYGFRQIAVEFIPHISGTDLGQIVEGGLTEGFLLAYLFFLPIIFIPAFYQQKLFYKLIPFSLIGLILMVIPWQALLLSLVIYFFGVLFGVLAVWLHKKI